MNFDAKAAKLLEPGAHIIIADYPGLRLQATATRRTWVYRYKSPVDGRMRQTKLGNWPRMSFPAAIAAWEDLKAQRDDGNDPVLAERDKKNEAKKLAQSRSDEMTVRDVYNLYLTRHIEVNRKKKGADEVRRTFTTMAESIADMRAVDVTRSVAFDLIQSFADTPVQASYLRRELGAAWDLALDAGRLPESAPNWWRLILRGKLQSKGKAIQGKRIGVAKRFLSTSEVGELIRWLPNFSPLVADILTLYLWTVTRGAEIVAVMGP